MLFQLVKAQATAQLNSDASSRQQQLKKLERGVTEPAEIAAPETNHEFLRPGTRRILVKVTTGYSLFVYCLLLLSSCNKGALGEG